MVAKSNRGMPKGSMRALRQYKDMPDEEFDAIYNQIVFGVQRDDIIEQRYNRLMDQFQEEYDLTELLPNDRIVLENLVNAMLQLRDYEAHQSKTSKEGITSANIVTIKELNNICNKLRDDISKMQNDLGITRKVRKSDKEQSVITLIEDLKKKAFQFYEQKMHYVLCPKCDTLLATVWWLYPDYKTNSIHVECHKETDGQICGWKGTITSKDLLESKGSNKIDSLPESMR